jgi:hypothetical protein
MDYLWHAAAILASAAGEEGLGATGEKNRK